VRVVEIRRSPESLKTVALKLVKSFRMIGLGRFELPTHGLGNRCSIHLSYRPIILTFHTDLLSALVDILSEPHHTPSLVFSAVRAVVGTTRVP
jgi:hypothetical protein